MKRYNTPHRHRVIKTRLTEEEYAEFSERVTLCKMSQAEFIRQALIKSSIRPVITVSPFNDELLSAVGKLTAEYGKIGGNLNQIARCLNEYGALYPHRPVDRRSDREPTESHQLRRQARSPVYEAVDRADRGREQTPERRQEERAGSGRKTDCGTLRYLQAAV